MNRLDGKAALVTGAATGIGAAIARRFAAEGAKVAITGRAADPLESVAEEIGGLALVSDATKPEAVKEAVAAVTAEFGGLDVVVPNVGAHYGTGVATTSDEDWAASMDVNLTSAFLLCREAMPSLLERRGSIVIISSLAGHFSGPQLVGYTVAKHALIGLTRSLARDYSPRGVRANAVCPAWTRTPLADGLMDMIGEQRGLDREGAYALVTRDMPLRRPAEPEEIAAVCAFLASDEASAMTGSVVMADGGASIVDLPTIEFDR